MTAYASPRSALAPGTRSRNYTGPQRLLKDCAVRPGVATPRPKPELQDHSLIELGTRPRSRPSRCKSACNWKRCFWSVRTISCAGGRRKAPTASPRDPLRTKKNALLRTTHSSRLHSLEIVPRTATSPRHLDVRQRASERAKLCQAQELLSAGDVGCCLIEQFIYYIPLTAHDPSPTVSFERFTAAVGIRDKIFDHDSSFPFFTAL